MLSIKPDGYECSVEEIVFSQYEATKGRGRHISYYIYLVLCSIVYMANGFLFPPSPLLELYYYYVLVEVFFLPARHNVQQASDFRGGKCGKVVK